MHDSVFSTSRLLARAARRATPGLTAFALACVVLAPAARAQNPTLPPIHQKPPARILRAWPSAGDWHVYLVRGTADETPSCLFVSGSAQGVPAAAARVRGPSTAAMPRVNGPLGATPPAATGDSRTLLRGGSAARGAEVWGFRVTGDEIAAVVDDRDEALLQMPLVIILADGEVIGALPVGERSTLESGLYSIAAPVASPALRDAFLGLLSVVDEVAFQLADRTLIAHLDQSADALRALGVCRQEARLLTTARSAR